MAEAPQSPPAEILAEAKLSLDKAVERARAGQSLGNLSPATLARLQAADGNTSCTNNTGCGRPGVAAAT